MYSDGSVSDYQALFRSLPGLFLVLTPDLTIVETSDAYVDATKQDRAQLIGQYVFDAFPDNPSDPAAGGVNNLRASLEHVLRSKTPHRMPIQKYDVRGPDGNFVERYWSPMNSPMLGEDGRLLYIVHRVEDVTEFVRSQASGRAKHLEAEVFASAKAAWEMRERLRIVVEGVVDHAVIRTDVDDRIVDWNLGAAQITGYSQEEMIGRKIVDILPPEELDSGGYARQMAEVRANGKAEEKTWYSRKGGRFFASGSVNSLRDRQGHLIGYVRVLRDSTDEKRYQDALRASEERYKHATEATRNLIWDWDLISDRISWNDAIEAEFGYRERITSGHWWKDRIHPDDRDRVISGINRHIESGSKQRWEDEYRFMTSNGEYKSIHDRGRLLRDESGNVVRMVGAMEDVSQERRSAALLRASEERFRTLLETIPHIVWFTNLNVEIEALSRQFSEYTGVSIEEGGLGTKFITVIHPDDVEATQSAAQQAKATRGPLSVLQRIRRADGQYRWNLAQGNPHFDTDGEFKGWIGTTTDVHERKLMEDALIKAEAEAQIERRKSENARAELHNFFMQAPVAMCIMSGPEHVYTLVNDAFIKTLGRNPLGLKVREAFTEADPGNFFEILDEVYRTGKPHIGTEMPFPREIDGKVTELFLDIGYHAMRGPDGQINGILALTHDVTEKVLARQAVEAASRAKSAFLANMSHEIRTPMTAILGFTEVLRDYELNETEWQDAITRIDNSGRALLRIIDDILDISKIEAGRLSVHRTKFSPGEVANDVVSLLRLSAETKGIRLYLEIDPSVPTTAHSDPARLRQILTNLIGNAIKFTTQGQVSLHVKAEDTRLIFDVTDTGIGISTADQSKLFRPFAQADASITRTFGGSGLGLLLSRRLAELLGGNLILVESTPGQGSHFRAEIEAAPFHVGERLMSLKPAEEKEVPHELEGVRILLAEDVADNQILMRRYLEGAGAFVRFAQNGREAIDQALSSSFDVVLMDIQMPVLDGIQATRELRAHGYEQPILALTAHAMAEEVTRSLSAGCNAHLTKPITKRALVEAVRRFSSQ